MYMGRKQVAWAWDGGGVGGWGGGMDYKET